jgi:hypothetical protein
MQPLSFADAEKYKVNRSQEYEVTRQSLYDFQTYAAAGQTSLTFFQVPIGQGGKTIADTNLELAGQLPAPKYFLVESIELYLHPADAPVTIANSAASPDSVVTNYANDVNAVGQSGSLDFFIGSKSYLQEAPLERFPPKTRLYAEFAFAKNATSAGAETSNQLAGDYAAFAGRPYFLDPYKVLLAPTQNFNVTLTWPAAVAVSADARIGVVMDGVLYRLSQ